MHGTVNWANMLFHSSLTFIQFSSELPREIRVDRWWSLQWAHRLIVYLGCRGILTSLSQPSFPKLKVTAWTYSLPSLIYIASSGKTLMWLMCTLLWNGVVSMVKSPFRQKDHTPHLSMAQTYSCFFANVNSWGLIHRKTLLFYTI